MKLKQREGCVVIESKQDQYFFKVGFFSTSFIDNKINPFSSSSL